MPRCCWGHQGWGESGSWCFPSINLSWGFQKGSVPMCIISLLLGPLHVLIIIQRENKGETLEEKNKKLIFFSSRIFQTKTWDLVHPYSSRIFNSFIILLNLYSGLNECNKINLIWGHRRREGSFSPVKLHYTFIWPSPRVQYWWVKTKIKLAF